MSLNAQMYIEPGYFSDGYVLSPCPVAFTYGATRIDLRSPSGVSGTVRLLQPEEYSTGWERYVHDPRVILHTLTLQWQRLSYQERSDLDAYFDLVDFSAVQSYGDINAGGVYPVWFDRPEISFEESSYRNFRTAITVWGYQPFHPAPAVPATIAALLGAARHPETVARAKKQPRRWLSDGSAVIYNKAALIRRSTTRSLRLTRDDLGSLIAHYVASAGPRDTWSWDSRTCRHASQELTWQRSNVTSTRYDVTVTIDEDV